MRHEDYLIEFAATGNAPTLAELSQSFPRMEWSSNDVTEAGGK